MSEQKNPQHILGEIAAGALDPALSAQMKEQVTSIVRDSFEQHREIFINALVQRLGAVPRQASAVSDSQASMAAWVDIESLSRLRSVVGGRFENLKKRWVEAGFPLREHRGDKEKDYKVLQSGWDEMAGWLLKHGFESRLTPDSPVALFQVREISSGARISAGKP